MYLTEVKGASFHCYFQLFPLFVTIHKVSSTSSWSRSPFAARNLLHL